VSLFEMVTGILPFQAESELLYGVAVRSQTRAVQPQSLAPLLKQKGRGV
jgi:hypothetical protein